MSDEIGPKILLGVILAIILFPLLLIYAVEELGWASGIIATFKMIAYIISRICIIFAIFSVFAVVKVLFFDLKDYEPTGGYVGEREARKKAQMDYLDKKRAENYRAKVEKENEKYWQSKHKKKKRKKSRIINKRKEWDECNFCGCSFLDSLPLTHCCKQCHYEISEAENPGEGY